MTVKCEWLNPYEHPMRRDDNSDVYRITKSRGKLTLEDIQQAVIDAGLDCVAVIMLKCFQDSYDGWDLGDSEEKKGDSVDVYVVDEGFDCPVCKKLVPMVHYCPNCGKTIDTVGESE